MKTNLPPAPAPLIAIVDDDASLRSSTRLLLASFGFESEAFARAQDFLKWPLLDRVSCLILDVLMPEMNGLELQQQLGRICPNLPIIFITAHAKEHEERQAMSAGAVAVLRKPVREHVLFNAIRRALRSDAHL